jgi:hypothetical protein
MANPFYDAYETSLSRLSDSQWAQLSNFWSRGSDWTVSKVGRKWLLSERFGNFPLFKTKKEACEAASRLILAESRWRGKKRWDSEAPRENR